MEIRVFIGCIVTVIGAVILGLISPAPNHQRVIQAQEVRPMATTSKPCPNFRIILDRSGSVTDLVGIWGHVREQLPAIVATTACEHMEVYTFGHDGWGIRSVIRLKLPPLWSTKLTKLNVAPEIRPFVEDVAQAEEQKRRNEAQIAYHQDVEKILRMLDTFTVEVPKDKTSPCSDVAGAVRRVATLPEPERVLTISDFNNTCGNKMEVKVQPVGGLRMVAVIASASDNKLWPADQYELRADQLKRIGSSWIVVVPPYTRNLEKYFVP